jgi:phosphoserine aminotransferase
MKPTALPQRPYFSSGPCAKRPGWSLHALQDAAVGRSHRAKVGKTKLEQVIERSKALLGIPSGWVLAIVPASDTGAVEMAMWSMLGERGVDVVAWEAFSSGWASDCKSQLKLKDLRVFEADYGQLPDLSQVDWSRDVVFAWNGTTSGVKLPDGNWIADNRQGLAICDATSAVFALGEARRSHVVVAEGAGRRRRARHDRNESARRAAFGDIQAGSPHPEDLPNDQGRQVDRGIVPG